MEKKMVKGKRHIQMVYIIKDYFIWINIMVMVYYNYLMVINMKVNFMKVNFKVKANFIGLIKNIMKVNGRMIKNMVKENIYIQMVEFMREIL